MARQDAVRKAAAPAAGAPLRAMVNPMFKESDDTLERLIHERIRLAIVSALAVNDSLTFNELKELLETSDGNLSVHARKLEEAGCIACTKGYAGRTPRTEYRITPAGRRTLEKYLKHMEALIKTVRKR
jgi:DNA-binding HxlR family transcriptional regulator